MARSATIKITLTPELHERLREVAAQLGQAPATCASMAVSMWTAQQARSLGAAERAVEAITRDLAPELVEQFKLALKGVK